MDIKHCPNPFTMKGTRTLCNRKLKPGIVESAETPDTVNCPECLKLLSEEDSLLAKLREQNWPPLKRRGGRHGWAK